MGPPDLSRIDAILLRDRWGDIAIGAVYVGPHCAEIRGRPAVDVFGPNLGKGAQKLWRSTKPPPESLSWSGVVVIYIANGAGGRARGKSVRLAVLPPATRDFGGASTRHGFHADSRIWLPEIPVRPSDGAGFLCMAWIYDILLRDGAVDSAIGGRVLSAESLPSILEDSRPPLP